MKETMIDIFFDKEYWVVDFLPKQVPENGGGRFFSVEEYYLEPTRYAVLREHFSNILLKLYCYYDLRLFIGDDTCMTVYEPSEDLLELIRTLAGAVGLFVWKPKNT